MSTDTLKLPFTSDYMLGAHPEVLRRLTETNFTPTPGSGQDCFCAAAAEKIRKACGCPDAEIHFLVGGTQTNATVIDALLRPYQGVLAADSGHIASHEAGAIEFGGHKVLTLPQSAGKVTAAQADAAVERYRRDESRDHTVMPGMVYISQPTELGTLYSLSELTALSEICRARGLFLYADGARLAYALACQENDVSLSDLARLCDAFYIGGTKCGALFGEAVVFPKKNLIPHFFTVIKQHGALLAKGRLLGVQFDALFTDGLYLRLGVPAVRAAERIRETLTDRGFPLCFGAPANQIFPVIENDKIERLAAQVDFSLWGPFDEARSIIRLVTDWAATAEATEALLAVLKTL